MAHAAASFRKTGPLTAFLTAVLAGITLLATDASATSEPAGVPENRELAFTVLRDGSEIGTHVIRFERGDDVLQVDVATDIKVTLPLVDIALYRFTHRGHEVWKNGRLTKLDSRTHDDGEDHELAVSADGTDLMVKSDVGTHTSDPGIVPASLWNPRLQKQSVLLNTLDGTEMKVTINDLGRQIVTVRGESREATHLRVEGDLNRELWYDEAGHLVKVRFKAEDDSQIEYVLR